METLTREDVCRLLAEHHRDALVKLFGPDYWCHSQFAEIAYQVHIEHRPAYEAIAEQQARQKQTPSAQ